MGAEETHGKNKSGVLSEVDEKGSNLHISQLLTDVPEIWKCIFMAKTTQGVLRGSGSGVRMSRLISVLKRLVRTGFIVKSDI